MKDPKSTVRYLGFQALKDGSRRFDFSFSGPGLPETDLRRPPVRYPLWTKPYRETGVRRHLLRDVKCRVIGCSGTVPHVIGLTSADVSQHRRPAK